MDLTMNSPRLMPPKFRAIRRNRLKLTQEQLAGLLGVSQEAIAYWETGVRRISPRTSSRSIKRPTLSCCAGD